MTCYMSSEERLLFSTSDAPAYMCLADNVMSLSRMTRGAVSKHCFISSWPRDLLLLFFMPWRFVRALVRTDRLEVQACEVEVSAEGQQEQEGGIGNVNGVVGHKGPFCQE